MNDDAPLTKELKTVIKTVLGLNILLGLIIGALSHLYFGLATSLIITIATSLIFPIVLLIRYIKNKYG